MKIIQITDTLDLGGAERVAIDLANEQQKRGHSVYFCSTRRGGALRDELNSRIIFTCLNRVSRFGGLRTFRKYIISNGIQIVHAHGNSSAAFCVLALAGIRIKIIHHDHNPVLAARSVLMEKIILRRCYAWIAVSSTIETWANEKVGARNVFLITNPVNLEKFPITPPVRKIRNPVRGVVLANYRPQKDHFNLTRALLAAPGLAIEVACYGAHYESEYRIAVDASITSFGLTDKIKLNGSARDITPILSDADVGILSSAQEGLPISLLEYMASFLPVAVTDVGECGKIVRESGCGLVVPAEDSPALAAALEKLINNQALRSEMGTKGRRYVEKHNSLSAFADRVEEVYNVSGTR